jgi:hypothetical protein
MGIDTEFEDVVRLAMDLRAKWIRAMPLEALVALRGEIAAEIERRDVCEHGVRMDDFCRACFDAMRRRIREGTDAATPQA